MDHIDLSGWRPPDGGSVADCVRIVRGLPGMIERIVVEVPASCKFAVPDLTIAGSPIRYGGQITECLTVQKSGIAGATFTSSAAASTRTPRRSQSTMKTGKFPVLCSTFTLLMLGPGTTVTHAAVRALADNGCLVARAGEEGVRFYAQAEDDEIVSADENNDRYRARKG